MDFVGDTSEQYLPLCSDVSTRVLGALFALTVNPLGNGEWFGGVGNWIRRSVTDLSLMTLFPQIAVAVFNIQRYRVADAEGNPGMRAFLQLSLALLEISFFLLSQIENARPFSPTHRSL